MGGRETEISPETKNVLLESAYFDPLIIRKAQRKLTLASESSYRFERGVDFGMVLSASARAQEMIRDIDGGRVSGKITDAGGRIIKEREISLSLAEIPRVLGVEILPKKVMEFFESLNLRPIKQGKAKVLVRVPSYRQDLDKAIDLIEELARLYGYARIPVKTPHFRFQEAYEEERQKLCCLERKAKEILYSLGLNEIVSYTLTSRVVIEALGISFDNVVRLKNPLSSNQEFMRPSLSSEMLEAASWNLNRKNSLLQLFELNKVYLFSRDKDEVQERLDLCIFMCGSSPGNWKDRPRKIDFFDLKGVIESFLDSLGISGYMIERKESAVFEDRLSSQIRLGKEIVGTIGEVRTAVAKRFDIKQKVYLAEISFEALLKYANPSKRFKPLPRYPSLKRDISIVVDDTVNASEIDSVIREGGEGLIKSIDVFDLYRGQQIEEGKKGVAYSIEYRSEEKTLKDDDINGIHKDIQERLVKKLGAQIR